MNNGVFLSEDIAFWTGFYSGDDPIAWASNKAYLDMNRTMTFRLSDSGKTEKEKRTILEKRNEWRDEVTEIIRNRIYKSNNSDDYDDWHKDTCGAIIEIYSPESANESKLVRRVGRRRTEESVGLTLGQAQKWLNMTLKYIWLLNRFGLLDNGLSEFVRQNQEMFHVPLDSYLIRYIKQSSVRGKTFDDNGLSWKYSMEDFDGYEWSKIPQSNYDNYRNYQKAIRDDLKEKRSPLEWELEHWHKAIVYYGQL